MRRRLLALLFWGVALLTVAGVWYAIQRPPAMSGCAAQAGDEFAFSARQLLADFERGLAEIKQAPSAPDLSERVAHLRVLSQQRSALTPPACAAGMWQSLASYMEMSITACALLEHDSDRDTINQTFDAADVAKQRFYREWQTFLGEE